MEYGYLDRVVWKIFIRKVTFKLQPTLKEHIDQYGTQTRNQWRMIQFDKDYHKPRTVVTKKQSGERLLFVWKISTDLLNIWAGIQRVSKSLDVCYVLSIIC